MHRPPLVAALPGAWSPQPAFHRWLRQRLAQGLRRLGLWLARSGRQWGPPPAPHAPPPPDDLPLLEFHADAGAPEGALYVNGQFVGRLDLDRL